MAVYGIDAVAAYTGNSGTITFDAVLDAVAIVDDAQMDTEFLPGDPDGSGGNIVGSYTITLTAGGTMKLLASTDGVDTVLFLPTGFVAADFVFPATLDTSTIDTSAYPQCFAAGTRIKTADADILVEDLQIGDIIRTATGADVQVKWIGRHTLSKLVTGSKMQPVCIRAGALGNGLPHADLTVTADHGMVIDGYVINASALVNGDTIDFVPMAELDDSFTVYHIETENHDVILANGAAAETFMDAAGRKAFDNYQEYLDLYGAERIIPEMVMPRISSQRLLPETMKERLGIGTMVLDESAFMPDLAQAKG